MEKKEEQCSDYQQEEEEEEEEEEYSVWALPPPELHQRIKKLMSALRSEFGGPKFDPHITLVRATSLTRESAIQKLKSASATISPFTVVLSGVSGHQLIYESTSKVMEISANCCNHFGYKFSRPYRPHSSLFYGNQNEHEAMTIQDRIKELDNGIFGLSFEVSSIALFKTDTKDTSFKSWRMVEKCDLN